MTNQKLTPKNHWDATSYQNNHNFVWKYGANLVEMLSPKPGERILDLGCGTGQLTNKIADTNTIVIGIDNSPTMIAEASKNYPHLEFRVADGTDFSFSELFDAVFSNAALHWMKPPEMVISCIWQSLKPGGRFVAEFGGKGNIQSILEAINTVFEDNSYPINQEFNLWYFPSISEYTTLLEKQGFYVTYSELFDRVTPLDDADKGMSNWLKMFANSFFSEIPSSQHSVIIKKIEQELRQILYKNDTWFADYKRLRVIAFK